MLYTGIAHNSILPNLRSTESAAGHTKSSSGEDVCMFLNWYKILRACSRQTNCSRHVIKVRIKVTWFLVNFRLFHQKVIIAALLRGVGLVVFFPEASKSWWDRFLGQRRWRWLSFFSSPTQRMLVLGSLENWYVYAFTISTILVTILCANLLDVLCFLCRGWFSSEM